MKAFRYKLRPSKRVERELERTLAVCRELYNAGLQERRDAYRVAGKSLSYFDQSSELPEIKEIRPDLKSVYATVLRSS